MHWIFKDLLKCCQLNYVNQKINWHFIRSNKVFVKSHAFFIILFFHGLIAKYAYVNIEVS